MKNEDYEDTKKLGELKDIPFSNGIKGIGISGVEFDEDGNFGGYIYASNGYGNMECYLSVQEAIDAYNIEDLDVRVEFDVGGKICYLHS